MKEETCWKAQVTLWKYRNIKMDFKNMLRSREVNIWFWIRSRTHGNKKTLRIALVAENLFNLPTGFNSMVKCRYKLSKPKGNTRKVTFLIL